MNCKLVTPKNKLVQNFKYLGDLLADVGKCDTEFLRRIGIACAFQNLSKASRNRFGLDYFDQNNNAGFIL